MASLTFSLTTTEGTVINRTFEIPNEQVARLLAAFAERYIPPSGFAPNGAWLVSQWIDEVVSQAIETCRQYEGRIAAQSVTALPLIAQGAAPEPTPLPPPPPPPEPEPAQPPLPPVTAPLPADPGPTEPTPSP